MAVLRMRPAAVRPARTAGAGHGQGSEPVQDAVAVVVVQAVGGGSGAEDGRLGQDAGDEPVHVVAFGRRRQAAFDRATEDVEEHQQEDDRLHGGQDQHVRRADVA
jgi:hypothetical protein